MQRRLFITGPSGSGKSALLRELLSHRLSYAGGYVTEGRLDSEGRLLGYDIMPAAAAAGVEGLEAQCFMDCSVTPPKADTEVFRNYGVQLLTQAEHYPFALLDGFGGFELLIPQFRNALSELLNSDLPCIGVIRTQAQARDLKRRFRLGDKFTAYTKQLHSALKADPDTLIIEMKRPGDRKAAEAIIRWIEEYVG